MGGVARLSHHANEQQILDETGLEASSNSYEHRKWN